MGEHALGGGVQMVDGDRWQEGKHQGEVASGREDRWKGDRWKGG